MEARKLKTIEDLLASPDEHVELIDGEIVRRPSGIVELNPDWVCEIVSPGHERKDTLTLFLLLQRQRVPFYWLIWLEDRVLIAHRLDEGQFRVVTTITGETRARIWPFDETELDLAYIFGE